MLLHDDAADWVETCPDPVRLLGESNPTRQTVTQFTSLFCQRFSLFFNGPYGYFSTEQPPELPQQPVLPEQPSQQSVKQPRIPEQALQSVLQLPDQPLQLPKQLMPVQSQSESRPLFSHITTNFSATRSDSTLLDSDCYRSGLG